MCLMNVNELCRQSFGLAMSRLLVEAGRFGLASVWDADLRTVPTVRAAALAGQTDRLEVAIGQAIHFGTAAKHGVAVDLLCRRRDELRRLVADAARVEIVQVVDVVALDADWGRKGRGARIIAAIRADGLTASEVAERFQLALSTAKNYIRKAK